MRRVQLDEEAIFELARKIDSAEARAEYLDQACGTDRELKNRVGQLLQAHDNERSFLEGPPVEFSPTIGVAPLAEEPGDIIGHYKLLQEIGKGGFGVVYMAEQSKPVRRKVALKIIKLGMDTQEVVARFEAERQALAIMDHPNIAKVFDAGGTETGRPYFVMELVKGVTITQYADDNNLSTEDRVKLFASVCRAVHHAHQKGVIHRDIKPSNVLVTLHDGKPVPKVIDFGVAKAMSQPLTERTMFTKYGQVIGTPQYMSPEQAEMSGLDIDTRSDVFSLGVLLYELLTGHTPFLAERIRQAGFDEMCRIIREEEPLKPSNAIRTLDADTATTVASHRSCRPDALSKLFRGELDWIVMKSLEKDRSRRYDTANDLAEDVERHLRDEAIEASPPSVRYRAWKNYRRHKLAYSSGVAIATALLIAFGVTGFSLKQSIEHTQIVERARAEAVEARSDAIRSKELSQRLAQKFESEAITAQQTLALLLDLLNKSTVNPRTGKEYTLNEAIAELSAAPSSQPDRNPQSNRSPLDVDRLAPRVAAQLHLGLGQGRISGKRRELAADHFRLALDASRKVNPRNPLLIAKCSRFLGYESYSRDLILKAIEIERKEQAIPNLVASLNSMGKLCIEQGDLNSAEKYLTDACRLFDSQDSAIDLADIPYMSMAHLFRAKGDREAEKENEQQAIDAAIRAFGKDLNKWARRGLVFREGRRDWEAEYALLVVAHLSEDVRSDPLVVDSLFKLGLDYRRDGFLERSEDVLKRAYDLAKRIDDFANTSKIAIDLAETCLQEGKLLDCARFAREGLIEAQQKEQQSVARDAVGILTVVRQEERQIDSWLNDFKDQLSTKLEAEEGSLIDQTVLASMEIVDGNIDGTRGITDWKKIGLPNRSCPLCERSMEPSLI